jgi:hypothetical protein
LRDAAVDLPGTHLSILEDHVETTARAVENWVVRHAGGKASRGRRRIPFRAR